VTAVGLSEKPSGPYERVVPEYEHGRPTYALAAVEHIEHELDLAPGATVLDLGAGTGKLTRMLADRELQVVALDPSPAMLSRLRVAVPAARTLKATAEAIPLPAATVDAVVAAQAFHWFDAPTALAEIHRVLRPGGGIALIWNRRGLGDPVQALLAELTDPPERTTQPGWSLDIPSIVAATGLFGPVSSQSFAHAQLTNPERLLDRLRSSSYVASLPSGERRLLEQRLSDGLERNGPVTRISFATIVHIARRV
jgi:SAM-dependent methyltransferase